MTHAPSRVRSIDVLRGLIMVVMALDHVGLMVGRFHSQEMWAGAWTRYSSALPFLTRFVTHFCAPGFFLLMGAGLAMMADARTRQGWTGLRILRAIAIRGLLLVLVATFLELPAFLAATLSGPPLDGNPEFAIPGGPERRWVLTVLFALGMSMVASAPFIRARSAVWAALAAAALLSTALTTPGPEHFDTPYGFLRTVFFLSRWSHGVWSQYPPAGCARRSSPDRRRRRSSCWSPPCCSPSAFGGCWVSKGFETGDVITLRVAVPAVRYRTLDHVATFHRELLDTIRAQPQVTAAGFVSVLPLAETPGAR